jgi:hypothetical protein
METSSERETTLVLELVAFTAELGFAAGASPTTTGEGGTGRDDGLLDLQAEKVRAIAQKYTITLFI